MKCPKALKRLNPPPLFRGSCLGKQDCIADDEAIAEPATPHRPKNAVEISNWSESFAEKSSITYKTYSRDVKKPMGKIKAIKAAVKRVFGSNRQAIDANPSEALDTQTSPSAPSRRFWRRRSQPQNIPNTETDPVLSTPVPPAGSPAAAALALDLPYPLPIVSTVDLSPLATGMQLAGLENSIISNNNSDDFVIRAFPGAQQHEACTPHPATGTMLIRPFSAPASTSPHFEVLSIATAAPGALNNRNCGISRRELTLNDVRDELDKIFGQLPAAKSSPTKNKIQNADVVVADADLEIAGSPTKSALKKAFMMSPTSDACVQTDLSDADDVEINSSTEEPSASATAASPLETDDGKALYAWGNSGRTMRLSAKAAAQLGMRIVVPETAPVAEPAQQQQKEEVKKSVSNVKDEKLVFAWGTQGHTMKLSKAAAEKLCMLCVVKEPKQVTLTPIPAFRSVKKASVATPASNSSSSATSVGLVNGAPTPFNSPEDDVVAGVSPCATSLGATTAPTSSELKKTPRPVRYSHFDAATVIKKLENNCMTPPPSTTASGRSLPRITLAELASTPLCELFPEMFGPGDIPLSPFGKQRYDLNI